MSSPRKPRFRYSLRALLVFITLFAVWGGYHANRGWKERRAEKILQAKAKASFAYGHDRNLWNPFQAVGTSYAWIVDRLWGDHVVTGADVDSDLNPEVAQVLGSFRDLETLRLFAPGFRGGTASGDSWPSVTVLRGTLQQVLAKRKVKYLYMRGFELSDADCHAIASGQRIEQIEFVRVRLSNQGLARLMSAPHLRRIGLGASELIDEEFPAQGGSPTLERISISAPISNTFGSFAAHCPNLTSLGVAGESIDDRFVTALANHSSLEVLGLGETSVTDKCIATLVQFASLKAVSLPSGTVSKQAIEELRIARPDLRINSVASDPQ